MSDQTRSPARRIPSLRRWLIAFNDDLLAIHQRVDTSSFYYPTEITLFERCVLTLEDRRFFDHAGIDWIGVAREFSKLVTFRKHGGASTIDMQFVRTVTGRHDLTVKRKLREGLLSRTIQYRYAKFEILRSYMAIAFFGSGMRGSEVASLDIYGKTTAMLDLEQSARLAAMLVFPKPRTPSVAWQRKHLRRANYIEAVYIRSKSRFDKLEKRIFPEIR